MSSASVTVLCPNARRQVVKVQASTKILEMIEEVCKKQGLDPNRFDLVFQKKHLDVTLTYRLSGVPNHAQLELVELESGPRQIAPVSVCLQLDDGTRLAVKEFPPAQTTLYAVLQAYSDLANERVTKALNSDNSSSLKPVVSYLNDQVIGHFQLTNTSLLDMGIASGRFVLRLSERQIDADEMERLDGEFRAKLAKKSRLDEIYAKKQNEQVLNKESDKRTIEVEPEKISVPQETPKQEPKKPKIEEVYHHKPEIKPKIVDEPIPTNEFVNFKFPEETRGQNLIASENELEAIERESREACDRIPVIFSLERKKEEEESASNVAASSSKPGEIDDEFFSVTIDDLRSRLSELKRMQNDEAPLMTRQMRELEKDKRAMKYSKVVVRISFKNGTMLQGLFRPKEPMNQLYKFVRSCLVSEDNDFQLFISPPKTILSDMKKTLFDAALCPASIVYFKASANAKSESPELKTDLKRVSLDEANELVDVNVHQTMRQIDHEGLKWLEKEGSLVQNILKGSSMATGSRTMVVYDDDGSAAAARQQRKDDDPVRQKMAKFFGSKK